MAILRRVIATGISPFCGTQIQGDVTTGVLPAGTTQGTALILSSAINDISTCPTNAGVSMPTDMVAPGDEVFIYNGGQNTLKVYGLSGDAINNGAANAAYSVTTLKSANFTRMSATTIRAILSS